MAWESVPPDIRAVFESVCTARQLEVVKLRCTLDERGELMPWRRIARVLGVSVATVKEHWDAAERKFVAEVAARRGYGNGPETSPLR